MKWLRLSPRLSAIAWSRCFKSSGIRSVMVLISTILLWRLHHGSYGTRAASALPRVTLALQIGVRFAGRREETRPRRERLEELEHGHSGRMLEVKTTKDYASGAKLIDDLSSELRQKILAFSGEIVGFEMEAPDLLQAVWELERTMQFDVAVAKGVSDFGDGKQRDDKDSLLAHDPRLNHAARRAATTG
jgi:hypothetical protein